MGNSAKTGLTKRGGIWHIDKQYRGVRICESTGTSSLTKAEEHLAKRMNDVREAQLHRVRESHTFRAAATKFLEDYAHKKSIGDDAIQLKMLVPLIGDLDLRQVHMGTLQEFIAKRKAEGVKTKTLNAALAVVRRILNVAASEWIDEQGLTWLETAPKIKLFAVKDARAPYPLTQEEQAALFQELPDHLACMRCSGEHWLPRARGLRAALGVRGEGAGVRHVRIPHPDRAREERRGTPRRAQSGGEIGRGEPARSHPTHVFVHSPKRKKTSDPQPVKKMNNTAWKSARERAADKWEQQHGGPAPEGFRRVRVHDLKHTFGRRLRASACRSRIARIYSATRVGASPRTTLKRS